MEEIHKLKASRGRGGVKVAGSKSWQIDFFNKGPPPIVVEFHNRKRRSDFYEKLVKLLDVKKYIDARAVLVAEAGSVGSDEVQLASSFGIYLVLESDEKTISEALRGADLDEVNQHTLSLIVSAKSDKVSGECRASILELLSDRWLTAGEIKEYLRWRFDQKSVYSQIRSLERKGAINILARTASGEGVFGLPLKTYPIRNDLSRSSRLAFSSENVKQLLANSNEPILYLEIARVLGLKPHAVTAVLRQLSREGIARKTEKGWIAAAPAARKSR